MRLAVTLGLSGLRADEPLATYAVDAGDVSAYSTTQVARLQSKARQCFKNGQQFHLLLGSGYNPAIASWATLAGAANTAYNTAYGIDPRGAVPPSETWDAVLDAYEHQVTQVYNEFGSWSNISASLWNEPNAGATWVFSTGTVSFVSFVNYAAARLKGTFPSLTLNPPVFAGYLTENANIVSELATMTTRLSEINTLGIVWANFAGAFNANCYPLTLANTPDSGVWRIRDMVEQKKALLLSTMLTNGWGTSLNIDETGSSATRGGYTTLGRTFSQFEKGKHIRACLEGLSDSRVNRITLYNFAHNAATDDADNNALNFGCVDFGTNNTTGGQWNQSAFELARFMGVALPANGYVDGSAYYDGLGNRVVAGIPAPGTTTTAGYAKAAGEGAQNPT
jgi:hypothetical protein